MPNPPPNYYLDSDGWWDGTSNGVQADKCEGTVTYTWHWQGSDPAPTAVVLKVEARAQWTNPSGDCDDGLGAYGNSDPKSGSYAGPTLIGQSQSQSGTAYVGLYVSGGAVTFTINASAHATWGTCSVGSHVTLTPVVMSVAGTLGRPDSTIEALIGQGQLGSVSVGSGSGPYQLKHYQWSTPTGVVFKNASWGDETYNNGGHVVKASHHYNALASTDLTQPTLGFFAAYPTTETVQVSVDVRLATSDPNADGPLVGRVSISRNVQIVAPELQYSAYSFGHSRLAASNVNPTALDSGDYTSGSTYVTGASFSYEVSPVQEFTLSQGFSETGLSQLMEVNYTIGKAPFGSYVWSSSGATVLDTQLHYDGFYDADSTVYHGGLQTDTPGMGLSTAGSYVRDVNASSTTSFHMFLIYQPPNAGCGTTIIPLAVENWRWNCNAAEGSSAGVWNNPTGDPQSDSEGEYPTSSYQWDGTLGSTGA